MEADIDVRKEDNMLQTNNYSEVKEYFERNCTYGYKHIRAWIVSPEFHSMYVKDKTKSPGSLIRLAPLHPDIAAIPGVNHNCVRWFFTRVWCVFYR